MNYAVGKYVFETKDEASEFCSSLGSLGAKTGYVTTDDPVTHVFLFSIRAPEPIEDFLGLIEEQRRKMNV